MGYLTWFEGTFKLDKPLKPEHLVYLQAFTEADHWKMRVEGLEKLPDPLREAVGLPVGEEGCYFIGVYPNPEISKFVLDSQNPPRGLPDRFCHWRPTADGQAIEWDCMGKFYDYEGWLLTLIDDFLYPWGYSLNGEVKWQGEMDDDYGVLIVQDTTVTIQRGAGTSHTSTRKP
jgi:hypothetical protein